MKTYYSIRVIKNIINRNFTFADLSKRFEGVDSSTGNIYCPFHENHDTPAAKMYWDEERQIWILHCFGECHRNFTAYDYVDLILCLKYGKYSNPLHFLKVHMPSSVLGTQLELYKKQDDMFMESWFADRRNYIETLMTEEETIQGFIERLYTS